MIVKKREIPIKMQKLEALLRRIPNTYPKRLQMEEELAKCRAGYQGEKSLDYYFSFLPEKKYMIFHDLRLSNKKDYFFQIDTLLLSSQFLMIIEVKNISGTITFDDQFHQLIRTKNGDEEAFPDPISQVNRQLLQLKDWLKLHKFPNLPIQTLIVISNPTTLIKGSSHSKNFPTVTHSVNLLSKLEKYEKKYQSEIISKKELSKITRTLLKKHLPVNYDILNHFKVKKSEIIKGVRCPECLRLPMKRYHGRWKCLECGCISKTAHIEAVKDYFLLIDPFINNRYLREFLLISSSSVSKNLLRDMNFSYTGKGKGRKYWQ